MSDSENVSRSPSPRQALATLFSVAAGQVVESETPPAFAHAIAGSIRHRANKVASCDAAELREVAASVRAFAEILLVCDPRMARGLNSVAFCVDVALDSEANPSAYADRAAVLASMVVADTGGMFGREWRKCGECRREFLAKIETTHRLCWACMQRAAKGGV